MNQSNLQYSVENVTHFAAQSMASKIIDKKEFYIVHTVDGLYPITPCKYRIICLSTGAGFLRSIVPQGTLFDLATTAPQR